MDPAGAEDDPVFPDADQRTVLEPGCGRCPALVDARELISWGVGPDDAAVMVVGEAPGAGDPSADRWRGGNLTGMAYTTRHSGRRIRTTLARAGYPDAYYTNAVKCFPPDEACADSSANGGGSNREPTDAELSNCRSHLLVEIERVDPAAVVTTGKHATQSVLAAADRSIDGFLDCVLDPIRLRDLGVTVVPILHPSYRDVWIARLGYEYDEYVAELGDRLDALTD